MEAYKPRRLRIIDSNLATYTGPIGLTEFIDGVTTEPVDWIEAARIGATIHVEDADIPGYQVNEAAENRRCRDMPADAERVAAFDKAFQIEGDIKLGIDHYTRAELEEIADKQGLAGVRELARAAGGTGRSILECINVVLSMQAEQMQSRTEITP